MRRLPSTNQFSTNQPSTKLQYSAALSLFFCSFRNGRGGAFCTYRYGAPRRMVRGCGGGYRGHSARVWVVSSVFIRFLEVFWRFFSTPETCWLGILVFGRVFGAPSILILCSTSLFFGLHGCLGVCIVVWVAAARRKKRRVFFGVSPSQERFDWISIV